MNKSEMSSEVAFGAIYPYILDETVEEIWINSPERIFIARCGKSELTTLILTAAQVRDLVERVLLWSGRRLDLSTPFVDARLPDGSRLHVAIPEVTAEHWAINIRKHIAQHKNLNSLVDSNFASLEVCQLLKSAVKFGLNIIISGGTQAGKTTLLNALVSEIPYSSRVITIEEVFELNPTLPDFIQLQTRTETLQGDGGINLRQLVKESLRMRPDRLIIGEVREAEALDLLVALNAGVPGMGTIHANTARDALTKLQTLPLLAGQNISSQFITPIVASAIDLLVQVKIDRSGSRKITEILHVSGRIEGQTIETETIISWENGEYSISPGFVSLMSKLGGK